MLSVRCAMSKISCQTTKFHDFHAFLHHHDRFISLSGENAKIMHFQALGMSEDGFLSCGCQKDLMIGYSVLVDVYRRGLALSHEFS